MNADGKFKKPLSAFIRVHLWLILFSGAPPMTEPARRVIYRGRKIDLALQPVRLADGSTAEREVVLHRGAVALVPMVDAEHVCLVRNERYAVEATLLEVP